MRYVYTLFSYILLPFAFLRLYRRGAKNPGYRLRWKERLGYAPFFLKKSIWIHSVSLGETIAATPLIKQLQKQYPNRHILVTNMTPTGSAHTQKTFGTSVFNCYLPYDVPHFLKRFLKRVDPVLLIIMETEIWPNMIHYAHQKNIPIVLANARLSERSSKGYGRFKHSVKKILNQFTYIAAQYQADGNRYLALGLAPTKLVVTGSIKFDITLPPNILLTAQNMRQWWGNRPVWIAASTHETEEEIILAAHRLILEKTPNALLIIAPRHPDRFAKVKTLCEKQDPNLITRSSSKTCTPETSIFLADTLGELLFFYAASDIAFVGGSLISTLGGHNPLEPAALTKPVLTGPNFFNFAVITQQLIDAHAATVVDSAQTIAQAVLHLIENPTLAHQQGQNAFQIVEQNRGALSRLCHLIEKTLPTQ